MIGTILDILGYMCLAGWIIFCGFVVCAYVVQLSMDHLGFVVAVALIGASMALAIRAANKRGW